MSRSRIAAPQIEPLEGKLLLSTTHAKPAHTAALAALAPFSIQGTLQMPTTSVATFQLNGQNMGTFKLRGKLGSMGQVTGTFVAQLDSNNQYMSVGEMTLSNRKGTVNFIMSSDPTDQTAYDYTIASGSGAFASATGSGKMATTGVANAGRTMIFTITPH